MSEHFGGARGAGAESTLPIRQALGTAVVSCSSLAPSLPPSCPIVALRAGRLSCEQQRNTCQKKEQFVSQTATDFHLFFNHG